MLARTLLVSTLLALLACAHGAAEDEKRPPKAVDLVFVLDTSASMEGLIDGVLKTLSKVITQIATAKPEPDVRLALLTYGGPEDEKGALDGGVLLRSDLTFDFDYVFVALDEIARPFQGGHEHVGRALMHAHSRLSWTRGALKIVFVAGNESIDQDQEVRVKDAVEQLVQRGVRINTIYCGGSDDGIVDGWRAVAEAGGGRSASVDHNADLTAVASPFDTELASLSGRLTRGYLLAGVSQKRLARVRRVDERARALGLPLAAERALAKALAWFPECRAAQQALVDEVRSLGDRRTSYVNRRASDAATRPSTLDRAVAGALAEALDAAGFDRSR